MKSDVETLSPTRVKLTVDMPFEELAPQLDAAYKRIASQVTVPGFRKGKVACRVIDQRFGRGLVLEEAVDEAVPAAFDKAVAENNLKPLGTPEFDVEDSTTARTWRSPSRWTCVLSSTCPTSRTSRSRSIRLSRAMRRSPSRSTPLRARFATLTDVERAAQDGDVLLVDLAGSCEGEEVEDLNASALRLRGRWQGGAAARLRRGGARCRVADEVRTFAFPAEAGEYEGKDIDVTVTVTTVRERELPAADDEFALMASEFDTMDELTEDVRNRTIRMKRVEQGVQVRTKLHDQLRESIVPLPTCSPARLEEHFHDGHGDDDHKAEFESEARGRIKSAILLDRIAGGRRWPRRSCPPGSCSRRRATG